MRDVLWRIERNDTQVDGLQELPTREVSGSQRLNIDVRLSSLATRDSVGVEGGDGGMEPCKRSSAAHQRHENKLDSESPDRVGVGAGNLKLRSVS